MYLYTLLKNVYGLENKINFFLALIPSCCLKLEATMTLLNMDMDMLQLPMADMLLSATDMILLNMDMDKPLPECSP